MEYDDLIFNCFCLGNEMDIESIIISGQIGDRLTPMVEAISNLIYISRVLNDSLVKRFFYKNLAGIT